MPRITLRGPAAQRTPGSESRVGLSASHSLDKPAARPGHQGPSAGETEETRPAWNMEASGETEDDTGRDRSITAVLGGGQQGARGWGVRVPWRR